MSKEKKHRTGLTMNEGSGGYRKDKGGGIDIPDAIKGEEYDALSEPWKAWLKCLNIAKEMENPKKYGLYWKQPVYVDWDEVRKLCDYYKRRTEEGTLSAGRMRREYVEKNIRGKSWRRLKIGGEPELKLTEEDADPETREGGTGRLGAGEYAGLGEHAGHNADYKASEQEVELTGIRLIMYEAIAEDWRNYGHKPSKYDIRDVKEGNIAPEDYDSEKSRLYRFIRKKKKEFGIE